MTGNFHQALGRPDRKRQIFFDHFHKFAFRDFTPRPCGQRVDGLPDARRRWWRSARQGARELQARRANKGSGQGPQDGQRPNPAVERDNGGGLGVDADRTSERRQCAYKQTFRRS